ncbi:MAG: NTP transferase domain-containing protein [Aeropyrum sp.]|nr:NTP transferase domain-containing protein [Aeropyrum sp.]MCE4616752.1 NTP transferase domain-containing protein [Aeropyrum sp.]
MGDVTGVVLAAGFSKRFKRSLGFTKVAASIAGIPLVCYPITSMAMAGVERLIIVASHYNHGEVESSLRYCHRLAGLKLSYSYKFYLGNGATLVDAIDSLSLSSGSCVLVSMADHLYTPSIVHSVIARGCGSLGVDPKPKYVDVREATKVRFNGGVAYLGKKLEDYCCVDIGLHFLPLESRIYRWCLYTAPEVGLADLITCASTRGLELRPAEVISGYWTDVDSGEDLDEVLSGSRREVLEAVRSEWGF